MQNAWAAPPETYIPVLIWIQTDPCYLIRDYKPQAGTWEIIEQFNTAASAESILEYI